MASCQEEGGSGGNGREFFLDTQGACFLCLQDPSSGGDGDRSTNGGARLEGGNLRDICRYLEIKGLRNSGFGRNGGPEFVVGLCGKCGVQVNELSELIRVLEETERGIAKRLQDIQEVMKRCLEREECKLQWEKIRENNPMEILLIQYLREETGNKGSEKLKTLTATKTTPPTELNHSSRRPSSNLRPAGMEPEAIATSSSPNLTIMSTTLSAPLTNSISISEVPISPSSDPGSPILYNGSCSQTATRTASISEAPLTRLINLSARPSSSLNQMDNVNASGSVVEPETLGTPTVSNSMATMAPSAASSTTTMAPSTHQDSSNETPSDASASIKGRKYEGHAIPAFKRNYRSQDKDGVPQFQCRICKEIFKLTSVKVRRHILSFHPEALFTNVSRSSHQEFKNCVEKLMLIDVENMILENGKSNQCKLCKVGFSNQRECRYHLVMKHYSILEKKLKRRQEGVGSDDAGQSVEGREGLSLPKRRVALRAAMRSSRSRFECLAWNGGCGKIFSKVEHLRRHEEVCEGKGIGGTLNFSSRKKLELRPPMLQL